MDFKETSGALNHPTQNTRILVNFKTQRVLAVNHHRGSKEWNDLINKKGYVEVAVIKPEKNIFILPEYFSFEDNYPDKKV